MEQGKTTTEKGLLEAFLGEASADSNSVKKADSRPARVSFEKSGIRDKESISIAYTHIRLIRCYGPTLYVHVGEHSIRLKGINMRLLYEDLHREAVLLVLEQPLDSMAEATEKFESQEIDELPYTLVDSIEWDEGIAS